jgi:CheY-like chemotaxis protein
MSHRILIADDEPNHRRSLSISLRLEGYEVTEAADGEQALEALAEAPVDVVVCDLMMPRVDGLELARRMRFAYPGTKVILMSAYHLTRAQLERAQVGEIRFLPKPYEFDQLEQHLAACLGSPAPTAIAL